MKVGLVLLLLVGWMAAQELPNAPLPQTAKKESSWSTLWNGNPAKTNYEVLKDWKFETTSFFILSSTAFSIEMTHAGESTGCAVEKNLNFGPHPTRAELYRNEMIPAGAIIGLGFLMKKARIPWVYEGMGAFWTQWHVRDGLKWQTQCGIL